MAQHEILKLLQKTPQKWLGADEISIVLTNEKSNPGVKTGLRALRKYNEVYFTKKKVLYHYKYRTTDCTKTKNMYYYKYKKKIK
jgi:hypothetical protein